METGHQVEAGSARILVVVAQAARGAELRESLRSLSRGRRLELCVLAPAFAGSSVEFFTGEVDPGIQKALDRLERSMDSLGDGEIKVTRGEVGDADPMTAIDGALVTFEADQIVLVPSPQRDQWAEEELRGRVCERFGLPVWEIEPTPTPASSARPSDKRSGRGAPQAVARSLAEVEAPGAAIGNAVGVAEASGFEQHRYKPPADSVEVVLVRHGASEAALPGKRFPLIDGQGDPALSAVGKSQARSVAKQLADEPFTGVFASNLRRTQETAAPLTAANGLEPTVLPDLREIFLGVLEGGGYRIKVAEGDPLVVKVAQEERWDLIEGAETLDAFGARLRTAIEMIVASVPVGTSAVAFAHGAVIGQLCSMATRSRPFAFIHADNGSISRLIVHGDGTWLLRSFNETRHLEVPTGPVG